MRYVIQYDRLNDHGKRILKAARILREGGTFPELCGRMKESFREVKLYGGFPVGNSGMGGEFISLLKRSAVKFGLIPGSLKGRAYLKRVFMGKLIPLPNEVTEGMGPYKRPVLIPAD